MATTDNRMEKAPRVFFFVFHSFPLLKNNKDVGDTKFTSPEDNWVLAYTLKRIYRKKIWYKNLRCRWQTVDLCWECRSGKCRHTLPNNRRRWLPLGGFYRRDDLRPHRPHTTAGWISVRTRWRHWRWYEPWRYRRRINEILGLTKSAIKSMAIRWKMEMTLFPMQWEENKKAIHILYAFFFYYNKCNTEMQHQSLQCLCLLNAPSVRLSCHPLLIHLNKEEKEAAAATE